MNIFRLLALITFFGFFKLHAASPMGKREQMRRNFGAGHPVFRVSVSHYGEMFPGGPNSLYGRAGNSEEGMMTRLLVNTEALVMVNNMEDVKTDGFSDKAGHFDVRPKFVQLQASYDYFNLSNTISASYAQSTTCNMGLGFLGYMRGYWSLGAASRCNRASGNRVESLGLQTAMNLHNSKHALSAKLAYFPKAIVVHSEKLQNNYNTNQPYQVSLVFNTRVSDRILYEVGVENNCPKTGFSYMGGSWRASANVRVFQKQMQLGFSLNHSL